MPSHRTISPIGIIIIIRGGAALDPDSQVAHLRDESRSIGTRTDYVAIHAASSSPEEESPQRSRCWGAPEYVGRGR